MKQTFYSLLIGTIILLGLTPVQATHFMGVDISYECTGPCTYRVYHKSYYDCDGAATPIPVLNMASAAPPAPSIGWDKFGSTCADPVGVGQWVFQSYLEVTPLCPDALNPPPGQLPATGCDGTNPNPSPNGVAEAVFYRDYDFCNTTCDSFNITWSSCCRNYVITSGASGNSITTSQTKINLTLTPCNNSPVFQNKPVPYICAGQLFTFNQGAIDPDGDSLSYELGPCFNGAVPVTYNNGYSATQPLGATWDVSINPLTGDITMQPNPVGAVVVGVMCVIVKEWRNGVQIGQVSRDMQITVLDNCTSSNPITGGVQEVKIGQDSVPAFPLSYNEARVCAGVEICFDIPVISQDTSLTYTLTWNQGIPGATFVDATNSAIQNVVVGDEPTATFCWTPPLTAKGAYFFVVTVSDDACPVPGFNQYTIIVYVEDVLANSQALGSYVDCNEMQMIALPQSTIPSPYNNVFPTTNWWGNGNLNINPGINDSTFFHLYPAPGIYTFNLFLEDTFGCSTNIPGFANLPGGVTADAGPDVSICSNFTFPMGTPALPGQFYSWTPGTALNNPNLAQPLFSFPNNGLVQDTIDYVLMVTDSVCHTFDYTRVIVNPTLQTSITPTQPVICIGDQIQLSALGNLTTGNTFLWSTGDTSQNINVAPATTTTYSVVTFNNGCSSDEIFVTVDVTTGPPAQIAGNFRVCDGTAAQLTASGGDTYLWSLGGFTQPNITIPNINKDTTVWVIAYDANGCPGDTTFAVIGPYEEPVAAFSAPTLCEGLNTSFSDLSTIVDGTIVSWEWDFDDGTTATLQNPVHIFNAPGSYNVELRVTSSNGCTNTAVQNIVVEPVPVADFTFVNVCEGDANTFTDNSSITIGSNIVSYDWNYGDGSAPGVGPNTTHTYGAFGYYNVTLTVVSDAGCADDYTRTVFVNPNPVADFEIISACEDSLVLASTASTVAGSLDYIQTHAWEFGDPQSGAANFSSFRNPSHVYQNAGPYQVTLAVTTQNGCTDVVQREVIVHPDPAADFTWDQTCENVAINFSDLTVSSAATPVESWYWDFGQGANSTEEEPFYRYRTNGGPGTYDVMLAVRTTAGCVDTIVKPMIVNPAPQSSYRVKAVCYQDTSQFEDVSTILSGSIVGWNWDFGDGNSSTLQNPAHPFGAPGDYPVTLSATSDSGCVHQWTSPVTVFELPDINTVTEDTICFGDQAFLLATTNPDAVVNWYASLDDVENDVRLHQGYTFTTPPLPFRTTYYIQPLSEDGCINTPVPVTAYLFNDQNLEISADNPMVELPSGLVNFDYVSTVEIVDWTWAFGDNNISNQSNPAHEYQYPGLYEVVLKTIDINGCEMSATTTVEVKKIVEVYLPNAFTPNLDGYNDTYQVGAYNINPEEFSFQVFNRWGQKVFETNDPGFNWNGKDLDGIDVPEGVYVFLVQYKDHDGNDYNDSRTITVIR
jgi:gliding motility-associated-like protein